MLHSCNYLIDNILRWHVYENEAEIASRYINKLPLHLKSLYATCGTSVSSKLHITEAFRRRGTRINFHLITLQAFVTLISINKHPKSS